MNFLTHLLLMVCYQRSIHVTGLIYIFIIINCICMLYICILSFYELPDTSFINAVLSEKYPCDWINIYIYI